MCTTSGFSLAEPEPNLFSFNSPHGACSKCNGLGKTTDVDLKKVIPDYSKSIKKGGILPLGKYEKNWTFRQIEIILKDAGHEIEEPISSISQATINDILYGSNKLIKMLGENGIHDIVSNFEGIINIINRQQKEGTNRSKRWAENFTNKNTCT